MAALTTIAAGVSIAATAATTGMSFAQAGKQNKLRREAEADAERAMKEAKKKLEENYYKGLGINKEPYELQREALLSQGAQAIQAGVESERGAAATAGRVQMAQNESQAGVRSAMGQEMSMLERLAAQEQSRLQGIGVNLDLAEAEGAQKAAAEAQKASAQAMMQGMQGVESIGQQVSEKLIPLYANTETDITDKIKPSTSMKTVSTVGTPNVQPPPNVYLNQGVPLANAINPVFYTPFEQYNAQMSQNAFGGVGPNENYLFYNPNLKR